MASMESYLMNSCKQSQFRRSLGQSQRLGLIVGPDDGAGRLALVEGIECHREGDDDGAGDALSDLDPNLGGERRLRAILQRGKSLEKPVEVDGRDRVCLGISTGSFDRPL